MADYAQGYTLGRPIRMAPGLLAAPAYGARATAGDMLRFVQANLGTVPLDGPLQQAVTLTRTAYYRVGAMTQDLVWEQYPARWRKRRCSRATIPHRPARARRCASWCRRARRRRTCW